jgi:proteasome lid subunit RPN8/RPN11
VTTTFALPNTTEEGRAAVFWCVRTTTAQAEKQARDAGGDLLGFYHSHPDHPARPSQYDLDHAWPFFRTSSFPSGGRARGHDVLAPA